jgi:hypothetical protein
MIPTLRETCQRLGPSDASSAGKVRLIAPIEADVQPASAQDARGMLASALFR